MKTLKKRSQRGATAIEYGLIAALMVLAIIPALQGLNGSTNGLYSTIGNKITNAMSQSR